MFKREIVFLHEHRNEIKNNLIKYYDLSPINLLWQFFILLKPNNVVSSFKT